MPQTTVPLPPSQPTTNSIFIGALEQHLADQDKTKEQIAKLLAIELDQRKNMINIFEKFVNQLGKHTS